MTKDEWATLETRLITWRRAELMIDGYHITLHLIKNNKSIAMAQKPPAD